MHKPVCIQRCSRFKDSFQKYVGRLGERHLAEQILTDDFVADHIERATKTKRIAKRMYLN